MNTSSPNGGDLITGCGMCWNCNRYLFKYYPDIETLLNNIENRNIATLKRLCRPSIYEMRNFELNKVDLIAFVILQILDADNITSILLTDLINKIQTEHHTNEHYYYNCSKINMIKILYILSNIYTQYELGNTDNPNFQDYLSYHPDYQNIFYNLFD